MRLRLLMVLVLALGAGFAAGRSVPSASSRILPAPGSPQRGAPPAPPAASSPAAERIAYREPPIPEDLTAEEKRNIDIFRRASMSVVHIANIATERDFFTLDVFQIQRGSGSGFVWDRDGHVVTNFHVIDGGDMFMVRLDDQSEYKAKVVGFSRDKDLAVLRITVPGARLTPIARGSSSQILVGQTVLALGNPFGLDHSLTVGVVSAVGRELQSPSGRMIHDVIQTDAAINPGNSGGPLLDSRGRLIGVNAAIFSPSGASAGIGFAVPVDTVNVLIPQLIQHGHPVQAGIGIVPLREDLRERLGLKGVVVKDVSSGSPAAKAGLEGISMDRSGGIHLGDRIVAVDGKKIDSLDDLLNAFEVSGLGKSVRLTVDRDGKKRDLDLTLVLLE